MSKETVREEVTKWMKLIYKNDPIPPFEDTEENLEILFELYKSTVESQNISNMYIQDLIAKTEDYQERTDKMRSCFEAAYLGSSCLEKTGQATLRHLAACACTLNLKDPSDTSFLLSMTQLKEDQLVLAHERKKEELLHRKISDSIAVLMLRTELLENKLALIGDQPQTVRVQIEKLQQDKCKFESNTSMYTREIGITEEHLKSVGLESSVLHSTLAKQSQKLREMEKKCDVLSVKLGRFQGLPANRDLAIAEVEKLKEEIRGLDLKLLTAAVKNNCN